MWVIAREEGTHNLLQGILCSLPWPRQGQGFCELPSVIKHSTNRSGRRACPTPGQADRPVEGGADGSVLGLPALGPGTVRQVPLVHSHISLQSFPPASGPRHSGLPSFPQHRAISRCAFWLPRQGGGARHGDLGGCPGLHEPDASFLWHRAPHTSTCLEPPLCLRTCPPSCWASPGLGVG